MTDHGSRPEFRVRVSLRNNRLVSAREDLGLSQSDFARAIGVSVSAYNALETLRETARGTDGEEWRPVALTVAAYHGVSPDTLFPPPTQAVRVRQVERAMPAADVAALCTGAYTRRALAAPDEILADHEDAAALRAAVAALPPRNAEVLRLRFGLDGDESRTLAQTGEALDVTPERIRQMEAKALRMLRHPSRSAALRRCP